MFQIANIPTEVETLLKAAAIGLVTLLVAHIARKAMQAFFDRLNRQDGGASRLYGIIVQLLVVVAGLELVLHVLGVSRQKNSDISVA